MSRIPWRHDVKIYDSVAACVEMGDQVRPDEPGASGNKDAGHVDFTSKPMLTILLVRLDNGVAPGITLSLAIMGDQPPRLIR
jgi:hypothetical protein